MKQFSNYLLLSLFVLILAGCGGTIPGWYKPNPEKNYLVGIATEEAKFEQQAVFLAYDSASRMIALQLNQAMSGCLQRITEEHGEDAGQAYHDASRTAIAQIMSMVQIRHQKAVEKTGGKYKVYIKVQLEKEHAERIIRENIKNNSKIASKFQSDNLQDCFVFE